MLRRSPAVVRALAAMLGCVLVSSLGLLAQPLVATAADPEPPAPFTIAVIPDTQGYSISDTLAATARAQTQWVVDHKDDLNIAFTMQLGDLVESWPSTPQWNRISTAFSTLDQNGIPYSVLPGNHDIDFSTGNAPTYNQYFPPSRFSGATWNTPTKRYGGYLGSNTFGADPVDRKNMDNFNLFSAGGVDWLVLNLEFESPDYSLAWAQKVIDAYPGRRVIMATHGFVDTRGWRNNDIVRTDAGVKNSNQVWNQFVYRNCSIDFVLNGHYHDGDLGEARRNDANACGEPVHQLLSDYQSRANGGDGWLRYYTFDPAADTVTAFTYSPTKAAFETDADSEFTLPYDFSPDPSVTQDVVVPGGASWKYRNQKAAWPAGWDGVGYDDSTWPSGVAPLGFPTGQVNTNLELGPPTSNRAQTMLFRRAFDLADLFEITSFRLVTKADDGLVVRVNGQEVGRTSMPAGTVGATTAATASPRSMAAQQVVYDVPLALLNPTGNVIAASTHLSSLSTSDAHFDLVAVATRATDAEPPTTENVTLVDNAAPWRWRFTNDAWPPTWTSVTYDDSGWAQGAAPLGFGATVATNIDVPAPTSNRPRSALFRRAFTIDDVGRYSGLRLTTRADDGVVLSLNGVELNRTRLPAGTLSSATYATAAPSTASALATPVVVDVPASALRNGTNVIAAATALNYKGTPNATFAAQLTAVRTTTPAGPVPAAPTLNVDGTTLTTASLSWAAGTGPDVTRWVLRRGDAIVADLPVGTTTFTDTGLSPATAYSYSLTAVNANGGSTPATAQATTATPTTQPVTLVSSGSTWRYLYPAAWPGGWTARTFDDSGWGQGAAPLGFGSTGIATNIDVPPPTSNRPRSALLRYRFDVTDRTRLSDLVLTTRADDGVVIYVNGQELGRSNVAAGTVGASTYASAAPRTSVASANPVRWNVPNTLLQNGSNTIAAVCLVNYRGTPDLSFDLTLAGTLSN